MSSLILHLPRYLEGGVLGGGLVRGRGGLVSRRGRLISGGGGRGVFGGGGGLVRLGLVLGILGGTLVLDISDVAVVVIGCVGHGLDTTVGKVDLENKIGGGSLSGEVPWVFWEKA